MAKFDTVFRVLMVSMAIVAIVMATIILERALTDRVAQAVNEAVTQAVQDHFPSDVGDVKKELQRMATRESALLVAQHMPKAKSFPNKFAMLEFCLQSVDKEQKGLFCEFGVAGGGSINFIASKTSQIIHGFDSFEGLPDGWREGFDKGAFKTQGLPKVLDNVRLHKGWFNESLPGWKKEYPGPIFFMHLDADLYASTKSVFDILADRMVPGTILQFDEFYNYPGWQEHEYKAFMELVGAHKVQFEYIGYVPDHQQVAVRILKLDTASPAPKKEGNTSDK